MNELDKYVKQELKVKYYIRYMDDIILLEENKEKCIYLKQKIFEFITEKLNLDYNEKE